MTREFYSRFLKAKEIIIKKQLLKDHLKIVAKMTSKNANKIELKTIGEYIGLRHDNGKYQENFQKYLKGECTSDGKNLKRGDIDHSTAGAKLSWMSLKDEKLDKIKNFTSELIALCIASHHSGLIDMLDVSGENKFSKRMDKCEDISLDEVLQNMDCEIKAQIKDINVEKLSSEIENIVKKISSAAENKTIKQFYLGMVAKFLLSCLIDADHTNSADVKLGNKAGLRQNNCYIDWNVISKRLEDNIEKLNVENKSAEKVKRIRKQISDDCFKSGKAFTKGCYKLKVPTGGGKTLASFRFAVEMAKQHKLDRIIYCIPYTTIIEQNADIIRKIVEVEKNEKGRIVIEYHSNLIHKNKTEEDIDRNGILTENWDAPIIFTTNVQILEVLFGGKPSNTRRLHQLANSVIIFDEIQTLPIKCVHMFNNAINFLVSFCGSTVVLCTATQPLLDKVDKEKGNLKIMSRKNIVEDTDKIFSELKRVEIVNVCKNIPYRSDEIARKAIEFADKYNDCLIVCNTTKSAKTIFQIIQKSQIKTIYHLSAKMCPAHRKNVLGQININLEKRQKVIVVSTQVIEAGVDIDFNCGIRALAGFDSIAQTAGRINRNGKNEKRYLYVCNFDEHLGSLEDIQEGKNCSQRIFNENKTITFPEIMDKYYEYYFYNRKEEMKYFYKDKSEYLLDMLSGNETIVEEYKRIHKKEPPIFLRQSFKEVSKAFQTIDALTKSIIVPYNEGQEIISKLCRTYNTSERYKLLKDIQQYSINLYPNDFEELRIQKAIQLVSNDLEIFYLNACYYDKNFGITKEAILDKGGKNV
jgi:CRISPR-associated endonuclease/helicase Cas3